MLNWCPPSLIINRFNSHFVKINKISGNDFYFVCTYFILWPRHLLRGNAFIFRILEILKDVSNICHKEVNVSISFFAIDYFMQAYWYMKIVFLKAWHEFFSRRFTIKLRNASVIQSHYLHLWYWYFKHVGVGWCPWTEIKFYLISNLKVYFHFQ